MTSHDDDDDAEADDDQTEAVTLQMHVRDVRRAALTAEGFVPVVQETDRGDIESRLYETRGATAGVVFVGGAGGGFDTPVRGWLYPRLAAELQGDGLSCLRVRYRHPNHLKECVLDVLAGISLLRAAGVERVGLVGHSFGGAVVIRAAALSPDVKTCVPMSTQTYGAGPVADLGPRCSLLLAHGEADEVLPPDCSRHVYAAARQPKKLLLKPGTRHGLDEWADELPAILRDWLRTQLQAPTSPAS